MTYAEFKAAVEASGGTVHARLTEGGYRIAAEADARRYVFNVEHGNGESQYDRYLRTIRDALRGHGYPVATEREDPSVDYTEVD